jgi:hypothetical protein
VAGLLPALLVVTGLLWGGWLLAGARPVRPAASARGLAAVPGLAGPEGGGLPRVSVIVPARDEEATLPVLLASVAALRQAPHELIVVDDGSTDRTATVARAAGARVLAAPPPPARWLGKPWACHLGAEAATGDHLLFLDADTRLAPDALGRLLDEHAALTPDGLLSVAPYHATERPYEELSAACNVVSALGTGAFAGPPGRAVPALTRAAFGPCLVTSAAAHRAVGGHAAVRGEVVEDVALAANYRAAGRPVRCLTGGDAVAFRMYPDGLAQLVEGWSKNLAAGAGTTGPRAPLALAGAVAWVAACVAVGWDGLAALGGLVAGAVGLGTDGGAGGLPAGAVWTAAAWAAVAAEMRWMLRRLGAFRWWTAVLFPIPLVAFVAVFFRSLGLTYVRRRVTWRGRQIALRAGEKP